MRISDWSSDVCSSDLVMACGLDQGQAKPFTLGRTEQKAGAGVKLFKKLVADPFQPEQPLAEFGVPSQPVWQTVNAPSQLADDDQRDIGAPRPKRFKGSDSLGMRFARLQSSYHEC